MDASSFRIQVLKFFCREPQPPRSVCGARTESTRTPQPGCSASDGQTQFRRAAATIRVVRKGQHAPPVRGCPHAIPAAPTTGISTVFSRNSRSGRNRPSATSACKFALVAERMRTSSLRVVDEPTRSSSPLFKHPQQLGLLPQRHIGDLIPKQRSARGQLKTSDTVGARIRERTLYMAEDLALKSCESLTFSTYGDAFYLTVFGRCCSRMDIRLQIRSHDDRRPCVPGKADSEPAPPISRGCKPFLLAGEKAAAVQSNEGNGSGGEQGKRRGLGGHAVGGTCCDG